MEAQQPIYRTEALKMERWLNRKWWNFRYRKIQLLIKGGQSLLLLSPLSPTAQDSKLKISNAPPATFLITLMILCVSTWSRQIRQWGRPSPTRWRLEHFSVTTWDASSCRRRTDSTEPVFSDSFQVMTVTALKSLPTGPLGLGSYS